MDFLSTVSAQCLCFLATIIPDFVALYHGSFRFISTPQERNGACLSSVGFNLSSGISKEGHNVVEINWHISALKVVKFMPCRFLDCLSSAWLAGLITERSHTTQYYQSNVTG